MGRNASSNDSFSPLARLLPYLEQGVVASALNFNVSRIDPANLTVTQTALSVLLCPSDGGLATIPNGWAGTNYRSNEGTSVAMWHGTSDSTGVNTTVAPPNGLFFANIQVRFADIRDGTSNTAAFSEHILGDFNNNVATERADTFWPRTYPANADEAVQLCNAFDWKDLQFQRVSDVGAPWIYGYHSTTSYWHTGPPNTKSCMFPPSRIMTVAGSQHPGGVNLALADGSVRFVKDTVNLLTWRALGTRAGNEAISADAY
jgi:prepilin-type processing-associated H-X9-DG protein